MATNGLSCIIKFSHRQKFHSWQVPPCVLSKCFCRGTKNKKRVLETEQCELRKLHMQKKKGLFWPVVPLAGAEIWKEAAGAPGWWAQKLQYLNLIEGNPWRRGGRSCEKMTGMEVAVSHRHVSGFQQMEQGAGSSDLRSTSWHLSVNDWSSFCSGTKTEMQRGRDGKQISDTQNKEKYI